MIGIDTADDDRQQALLDAPIAAPGSGMIRYAAAMYFYNRGRISDEALEVYRVCAKIDHEDPAPSLRRLRPGAQGSKERKEAP